MMKASQRGIDLITRFEGWSKERYWDENDGWTIGFGHLIKPGEHYVVVTIEQARELLKQDVRDAEDTVNDLVPFRLPQSKFDALVSFVYNEGRAQFAESTLLRKLRDGDIIGAWQEFSNWIYDDGKPLLGLARRRAAEGSMFLED